jgi:hypothetical protein
MRVTITPAERDLIERTLRFANLRHIASTAQVEALFMAAPLVQATTDTFKVLSVHEVEKYRADDRPILQAALAGIATGKALERRRWEQHVTQTLEGTTTLQLRHGRLTYRLDGVLAATWLAVAFLLDEGRGLTNRLGQCRKPGCGKFNLTFEGKRRVFCSDAHRLAYDRTVAKHRVRAWRKRQKEKEE